MAYDLDLVFKSIDAAKDAELSGDVESAITSYEAVLKQGYPNAYAYTRLMILYRKQKKYKDELRVITRGIKIFKTQREDQLKQTVSLKKNRKQVKDLSDAFMIRSGLKDKKGNHVFYPEPINNWMKRQVLVEKRLAALKSKGQKLF